MLRADKDPGRALRGSIRNLQVQGSSLGSHLSATSLVLSTNNPLQYFPTNSGTPPSTTSTEKAKMTSLQFTHDCHQNHYLQVCYDDQTCTIGFLYIDPATGIITIQDVLVFAEDYDPNVTHTQEQMTDPPGAVAMKNSSGYIKAIYLAAYFESPMATCGT